MTNEEAIKFLQQLYPNGGHCWLDEQRIDAIGMAVKAMQEEPGSEELKTELNKYIKDYFTIDREQLDRFGIEEKDYMYSMDKSDMLALVEHFTNWQKTKDESTTEDLGGYINELSKQFPEVSFAKLSRIAVRVAKWQHSQLMRNAIEVVICDDTIICNAVEVMKLREMFKGQKVKIAVIKEY